MDVYNRQQSEQIERAERDIGHQLKGLSRRPAPELFEGGEKKKKKYDEAASRCYQLHFILQRPRRSV